MLYHLLYPLNETISAFNLFRYITFRTIYASLTALVIAFFLGPFIIRKLRSLQIGQFIREDGPKSHFDKAGTPTMGGVLIIAAILISSLLWTDLTNVYVLICLFSVTGFFLIGFADDFLMQIKKQSKGLSVKEKFALQFAVALATGTMLYFTPGFDTTVTIPFFKQFSPDLGPGYIIFTALTIVFMSNAVNLTDGLDGLAIGPIIIAAVVYMIFAYASGHSKIAGYLHIQSIVGSGEIAIICGTMIGAGLGFLWFNSYPAQIFMGDTGSLPLGAILGTIAVITKQEIMLAVTGGLFVIEALSVMLQVGYFKYTKGKRLFRMAPIHHHFELKGWPEPKVTTRFWIISIMLALISLSTLKIR